MLGGEAADRVAGFWRALGREVPGEPDHLSALLGLYAGLADAEARESAGAGRILRRESRKASSGSICSPGCRPTCTP